jgi:hypothetical protein
MDTIDEVLATSALSSKYSAAVQAALSVGKKTLNRYYAKTDLSNTYRIAMGTHFFLLSSRFMIAYWYVFSFQSFILATSSPTSKKQSGKTTGSRLPGSSYVLSSTFHTDIPLILRSRHWVTRCAWVVFFRRT